MNDERTSGLIIRLRPLTETSLIICWLTPNFGRISTVAKGARRSKSPFRGKLDLFYYADFSFLKSRRSDLHTLREINLRETNPALRQDISYLQQTAYCSALIEQTTETDTPLPNIFQLVIDFLKNLPLHKPQPLNVFAFEMKLLHELGLKPDFTKNKLSAGTRQILENCVNQEWPALLRLKLSKNQITEIGQFLHGFLIYHLEKIPKGRSSAIRFRKAFWLSSIGSNQKAPG
ncbi:MAG: DNA repair protein RecO [Verrucomicrobiota bacterium]|nr:DNA repair protein RecO [Verrucomicrobiota bacterium]